MRFSVHCGDLIDVLKCAPPDCVDSVVTSPPYAEQRKNAYQSVPEGEYPEWTVVWMSEVRRVLKPSGSVIINIRPHIRDGQISDYTLKTRLALREDGWFEAEELIWYKPDAPPLGSGQRPRRSWESLHWFALGRRPYSAPKANGKVATEFGFNGGVIRRNADWQHYGKVRGARPNTDGRRARCRDIVEVRVDTLRSNPNDHPARYPVELAAWAIRLVTPPGGVVLDPFMGSGSTGAAALGEGMAFIGIDQDQGYVDMAKTWLETLV